MQNEQPNPLFSILKSKYGLYGRLAIVLPLLLSFSLHQGYHPSTPDNEGILGTHVMPFGHAHNDYQHERPLWDALSHGFTSVEADVHLVGNELYLGHLFPKTDAAHTLASMYLAPLNRLLEKQAGRVYPGYEGVFYLMIDIKTDSLATYRVLREQLQHYPALLCNPHFQVFISGNRALWNIQHDPEQLMAIDGRPEDLSKNIPSVYMPVVSDNFKKYFKWRGRNEMPVFERKQLDILVRETHKQGKKIRFWAIPDQANVWKTLIEAGVDFINTDHLEALEGFSRANAEQLFSAEVR